ncbi:hypothetical protein CXG81DRAFT_26840 [Caulochytrium protostelioides]|uniref:L domain-like protein n=1 Tax=Caulochytrium protostelioides TaxID=1555241 RepID=A0A4P9X5M8_9FUNG|nr:hypothetical protein CXG81DRAFT_26840 [Caulochytrium protostelioides]|eukprot:RKP00445.1 hypothetical protein CXG81DRAFT_26840 [Caulochytrium protostelioides]
MASPTKPAGEANDASRTYECCGTDLHPALDWPDAVPQPPPSIESLILRHAGLYQLPSPVMALGHLHTMKLSGNRLSTLPEEMILLAPSLRVLDVSDNQLVFLPDALARLELLEILNLHSNQLSDRALPLELSTGLRGLRQLLIHNNRLRHVAPSTARWMAQIPVISVHANAWTSPALATIDDRSLTPTIHRALEASASADEAHNGPPLSATPSLAPTLTSPTAPTSASATRLTIATARPSPPAATRVPVAAAAAAPVPSPSLSIASAQSTSPHRASDAGESPTRLSGLASVSPPDDSRRRASSPPKNRAPASPAVEVVLPGAETRSSGVLKPQSRAPAARARRPPTRTHLQQNAERAVEREADAASIVAAATASRPTTAACAASGTSAKPRVYPPVPMAKPSLARSESSLSTDPPAAAGVSGTGDATSHEAMGTAAAVAGGTSAPLRRPSMAPVSPMPPKVDLAGLMQVRLKSADRLAEPDAAPSDNEPVGRMTPKEALRKMPPPILGPKPTASGGSSPARAFAASSGAASTQHGSSPALSTGAGGLAAVAGAKLRRPEDSASLASFGAGASTASAAAAAAAAATATATAREVRWDTAITAVPSAATRDGSWEAAMAAAAACHDPSAPSKVPRVFPPLPSSASASPVAGTATPPAFGSPTGGVEAAAAAPAMPQWKIELENKRRAAAAAATATAGGSESVGSSVGMAKAGTSVSSLPGTQTPAADAAEKIPPWKAELMARKNAQ